MSQRLLVISRGPSFADVVSLWAAPWLTSDERSSATFSGHYADTGQAGSVTMAFDSLAHQGDKDRSEVHIAGPLLRLNGVPVQDERRLGFYYHTETQTAHILI